MASSDQCRTCGAGLFPGPRPGPVPRDAIPQSIAGALLLAHTLSVRERAVFELLGQGYDESSAIVMTTDTAVMDIEATAAEHGTGTLEAFVDERR